MSHRLTYSFDQIYNIFQESDCPITDYETSKSVMSADTIIPFGIKNNNTTALNFFPTTIDDYTKDLENKRQQNSHSEQILEFIPQIQKQKKVTSDENQMCYAETEFSSVIHDEKNESYQNVDMIPQNEFLPFKGPPGFYSQQPTTIIPTEKKNINPPKKVATWSDISFPQIIKKDEEVVEPPKKDFYPSPSDFIIPTKNPLPKNDFQNTDQNIHMTITIKSRSNNQRPKSFEIGYHKEKQIPKNIPQPDQFIIPV